MSGALDTRLLDHLRIGVILLDAEARVRFWNAWVTRHSGLPPEHALGRSIEEVFPDIAQSRLAAAIEQSLRFKLSSMLAPGLNPRMLPLYQKAVDRAGDQRIAQLIYVTPVRQERIACLLQVHDMTATVRRERRLRAQSSQLMETTYSDPLTGVGNRRRFDRDLAELFATARAEQKSLALLMIDVDDFKAYNDRLGHPKGDECLVMIAKALQEGLRQNDDRVSRYGGEEFVLPLPNADLNMACAIAERLREHVAACALPHPASRVANHITVSIGVSAILPAGTNQLADNLVAQADLALYTAKDLGRNTCAYFDPVGNTLHACC